MTFIDPSTAAHAAAFAPTRTALRAGALITAARSLLPALEAGTTITSAMLREAMVAAFGGSDAEGQNELGNFIDPEARYPVIVTTSRLLSTGVDAQTCRLIVLDRAVGSMTEFKQIVGRGTRVHEDTKKFFFTLIDFRGATSHFADPDFDGDVPIYEPREGGPIAPPDDALPTGDNAVPLTPGADETVVDQSGLPLPPGGPIRKIYVDGVGARILAERVEYLDENGKLVTESLRDFTKTALKKRFASLDDFLKRWKSAERKQAIIEELEAEGLAIAAIADELGKNLDPFDLICHVAFDKKPLVIGPTTYTNKLHIQTTRPMAILAATNGKFASVGRFTVESFPPLQ